MPSDSLARARHIKDAIVKLRTILAGKTYEVVIADLALWPAFVRYLEIISEASRHIEEPWRSRFGPGIAWRSLADLGNHLRHVYDKVEGRTLWAIYVDDLDPLEAAIDRMIAAHGAPLSPPRSRSS